MAALATLEIEGCGLTTRTIQQISSSLHPESSLVKLCIGELVLALRQRSYLQNIKNAENYEEICLHSLVIFIKVMANIAIWVLLWYRV
jgi:hypothetical protein